MARIVPSAIVSFLEFSELAPVEALVRQGWDPEPELNAGRTASVSALLDMADRLPDAHYQFLAPDEYARLITALGLLRGALSRWVNVDGQELGANGGRPFLRREAALGGGHPARVLRDLFAKCPDDPPSATVAELTFLGDPALAEVLRLDMSTAHSTLANGEFKASCVMAGSVIEALLLWALKRKERATPGTIAAAIQVWGGELATAGQPPPPKTTTLAQVDNWVLFQLINVARRTQPVALLAAGTAEAAGVARNFRNMVHPSRAEKTKATLGAAHIGVGVMRRVAEELEALVTAGSL